MHAPLLSSPTESDPPHRRHRHGRVGMPAYHLAKTVGIYGGTTPRGGLHHAAGFRRPMVPTLCSAERVSRRLRPLIESGAVGPAAGFVRTQVETDASSSSCSPTSNRGAGATESCTTNAARCSPQQFAHAPPPSSPRFRFAWTKHLPTHSEELGAFPPGIWDRPKIAVRRRHADGEDLRSTVRRRRTPRCDPRVLTIAPAGWNVSQVGTLNQFGMGSAVRRCPR